MFFSSVTNRSYISHIFTKTHPQKVFSKGEAPVSVGLTDSWVLAVPGGLAEV